MFWFDGYKCKHANDGTVDKIKAAEFAGLPPPLLSRYY